jgi:hypothetical protein
MVQFIKDKCLVDSDMVKEIWLGLIMLNMMGSGVSAMPVVKVPFFMLMKMFIMGNGLTINVMVMVNTPIIRVLNIKVNGKMTPSMDMEWRLGQTDLISKDNIKRAWSLVKENINGLINLNIKENGKITKLMELVITSGKMEGSILANGSIMICMELVFILILMESFMKDNSKMIKKMDTEYTNGWMEDGMKAIGTKGNSMGLEFYTMKKNCLN